MSRSHIQDLQQSKLSKMERKQLELQLLMAFDNEQSQNQAMIERRKQSLPQGIVNKSYTQKISVREFPRRNHSVQSQNILSKSIKQPTSRNLLLLKAIQQPTNLKCRYENPFNSKQQPTNRSSNNSKASMSSVKSFHLNKRKRLMTEYYEQKQTQKLVKKLLNIKPSQQVNKQVQLKSYHKHVMLKNIMMHRVSDQPVKKDTLPLKNKTSKKNSIDLKQKDLCKFLKEEKKKTRQESLLEKRPLNNQPEYFIYKRRRLKTQEQGFSSKENPYSKSSLIIPPSPFKLPQLKVLMRRQSTPIEKSFTMKNKYKTEIRQKNKNYF